MVEFTEQELEIILESSREKLDGRRFSFKGLSQSLTAEGANRREAGRWARELGERIKASADDPNDDRLPFRRVGDHEDGSPIKIHGGSIAYVAND